VNTSQSLVFYSLPFVDKNGPVTDISTPEPPAGAATSAPAAPGA
jgi:hypothetical protein